MRWWFLILAGCSDYKLSSSETSSEQAETLIPDIQVTPSSVDFGEWEVDETTTALITIQNVGTDLLGITELSFSEDDAPFSMSTITSTLLEPDGTAEVTVTFYAREPGTVDVSLRIDSIDPDEPTVSVPLTATVAEPAEPFDTAIEEKDECECPEGYTSRPAMDGCERVTTEDAIYNGTPQMACPITPYFAYGMSGVWYPDGTTLQDSYWGQNDNSSNGPLNRVGIWGCEKGDKVAGSDPIGQWIGFAVCMELDDPGDYLLGAGADNRVRLFVDGNLLFERDDGQTSSFNYWWISGISLTSGTHVIELYGHNDGSIAGFGAEIVGPFASGTASADDETLMKLDYANNIIWSTEDVVGNAFTLGEEWGWSCPDGSVFDACEEEPICVTLEKEDCL